MRFVIYFCFYSPPAGGQETAISRHITTYRQDRRDLGRLPNEWRKKYEKNINDLKLIKLIILSNKIVQHAGYFKKRGM